MKKKIIAAGAALATLTLAGCSDDAEVAGKNLSKDADNFKIVRRVVFLNGITDKYLLSIEGRCSITDENNQLEVTCKLREGVFKKHFLGLSDNVTYFVEQLEPTTADPYHYRFNFRPETILPDIEIKTSQNDDMEDDK